MDADRVLTPDQLKALGAEVASEDWTDNRRVHNWRRYIPRGIEASWTSLSDEARGVAYVMAEIQADNEHWD